jgi:hypothetical protein
MAALSLETRYINYLNDTHFKGYAEQLLFDNEKEYYRGMFQYLSMGLSPECLIEDKEAFERIIEVQRKCPWVSAQKEEPVDQEVVVV